VDVEDEVAVVEDFLATTPREETTTTTTTKAPLDLSLDLLVLATPPKDKDKTEVKAKHDVSLVDDSEEVQEEVAQEVMVVRIETKVELEVKTTTTITTTTARESPLVLEVVAQDAEVVEDVPQDANLLIEHHRLPPSLWPIFPSD